MRTDAGQPTAARSLFPPGRSERQSRPWIAGEHNAGLLANHDPVVAGSDLDAAVNAIEELEETAKVQAFICFP